MVAAMKIFIVDAFTDDVFKGNPAGVCLVTEPLNDQYMQSIAQELNLSETAFIQREGEAPTFGIRYFSPKMEIPLCGHATLASARVIFNEFGLSQARFITRQKVELNVQSSIDSILMAFPIYETKPAVATLAMLAALGVNEVVGCVYNEETKILLIEISSAMTLRNLTPDFEALRKTHESINGVLVTAISDDGQFDFHSRYFWPWSGTNEDPVTGGTHTFLAKYWARKLGKTKMKSFQSSKRTGFMTVEIVGDVLNIRSQAIIVLQGSWMGKISNDFAR